MTPAERIAQLERELAAARKVVEAARSVRLFWDGYSCGIPKMQQVLAAYDAAKEPPR